MFFPNKIVSINPNDKVLEIGPGATPHSRANAFLEYRFDDEKQVIQQRGDIKQIPDYKGRPVFYYSGDIFPFVDGQFDYVIVSHVLEHVPNPSKFISEILRISKGRGYLEFPLPPYDYLFNFDVHTQFLWMNESKEIIYFLKKTHTNISKFNSINSQLRKSLELGWDDLIVNNLDYFFIGFEFDARIKIVEQFDLSLYEAKWQKNGNTLLRKLMRRFNKILFAKILHSS
jgi:SAM-dependent methyltransferase